MTMQEKDKHRAEIINSIEVDVKNLSTLLDEHRKAKKDDTDWDGLFISMCSFIAEKITKLILFEYSPLLLSDKFEVKDYLDYVKDEGKGYSFAPSNWLKFGDAFNRLNHITNDQFDEFVVLVNKIKKIRNAHIHCSYVHPPSKVSRFLVNQRIFQFLPELDKFASSICEEYEAKNFDLVFLKLEPQSEVDPDVAEEIRDSLNAAKAILSKKNSSPQDVLDKVYKIEIGEFEYDQGLCPNCGDGATVYFDAEYDGEEDEYGYDGVLHCQLRAIFCSSCGFAADSSYTCEGVSSDFDTQNYLSKYLKPELDRDYHGEITTCSYSPIDEMSVVKDGENGIPAFWSDDF